MDCIRECNREIVACIDSCTETTTLRTTTIETTISPSANAVLVMSNYDQSNKPMVIDFNGKLEFIRLLPIVWYFIFLRER